MKSRRVPSVLRSLICRTENSGPALADIRYALSLSAPSHARQVTRDEKLTNTSPDMPVLLQQYQNHDERSVPGMQEGLR